MIDQKEIVKLIGQPESDILEYKPVLIPSKSLAQMISSFANNQGGYLVLGVSYTSKTKVEILGISSDFNVMGITNKALDYLEPKPIIDYQYLSYQNKNLFVIHVQKSDISILYAGQVYKREYDKVVNVDKKPTELNKNSYIKVNECLKKIEEYLKESTSSKKKVFEHYQSILKIIDELDKLLYPDDHEKPTTIKEGILLTRILFSSYVDSFETYLSELLYEIYLAKPVTLKTKQEITIEEVLNCSDMEEFIHYVAKEKIGKLQKGSVKGFIKENKQISDLKNGADKILDESKQNEIERILQIRHLYTHRNGIIDEKFIKNYTGTFTINDEHKMSISEVCDKLNYLIQIIDAIDNSAILKYNLSKEVS